MEIRVLEYFVEAAREKNISRAAEKLHVSQPAVSKQLKQLEEELGKKLFRRSIYQIELTTEGEIFKRRAEDILEMVHKTKVEFETMENAIAGEIHIGCAESDSIKYIAKVIKNIQNEHKNIHCHIYSGNGEDLYHRLETGLLDFSVTVQNVDISKYDYIKLPTPDIWGVIMRKDSPLSHKQRITLDDLRGLPLILSREAMKEEYLQWFGNELDKFYIPVTYNLLYNAAIMVREGLGYAISLDKLANTDANSELCFRPLYPELKSELRFIWKKSQLFSPAAELLLREMKTIYA
ncbi:MAG: LysR family transcriptional regulator [Selenomonadaceae bacterium]|nr:LysR family transcriptional regulator [Selenomonadaceae bacterium]MBR1859338.1 LysR family transcriptional regulator [Selenomonadaceae bacterium]